MHALPQNLFCGKVKENIRIKNQFWEKLSDIAKDKIEIDFYIANQKYLKFCETILNLKIL